MDRTDDLLVTLLTGKDRPANRLDGDQPSKHGITIDLLSSRRGTPATKSDIRELGLSEAICIYRGLYLSKCSFLTYQQAPAIELLVGVALFHGLGEAISILDDAVQQRLIAQGNLPLRERPTLLHPLFFSQTFAATWLLYCAKRVWHQDSDAALRRLLTSCSHELRRYAEAPRVGPTESISFHKAASILEGLLRKRRARIDRRKAFGRLKEAARRLAIGCGGDTYQRTTSGSCEADSVETGQSTV